MLISRAPFAAALITALALTAPHHAQACTAFALPGYAIVGKSYDWHIAEGFLLVNKRGMKKVALLSSPKAKPTRWVSRHGSVTFNQYGRGMPNGGMNDAGLVVEILWLNATRYAPIPTGQPAVNELQWIQLLLDQAATLDEALKLARTHGISPVHGKVHYLVCDAQSRCAVVEHVDGKQVITRGASLPVPAITNNTYAQSLSYWRGDGSRAGRGSLARFARAADVVRPKGKSSKLANPVKTAFRTLVGVQSGSYSKWQIVYDQRRKVVHFRQAGAKTTQLRVALSDLRFDCGSTIRFADLTGALGKKKKGRQNEGLQAWTLSKNQRLVRLTLGKLGLPPALQKVVAAYPGYLRCAAIPELKAR
ncbi:MAG: hypothetical protein JRH20_27020 [Deltaproteobacteria bacterium]|nr:hypothetical protein [Deltaproteobacteria bacterium]